MWTIISIAVYVGGFGVVAGAWQENIALGIMALLFALMIITLPQRKAISLAKEQRKINGKGFVALLLAYILPSLCLAGFFFFFVFGYIYMI